MRGIGVIGHLGNFQEFIDQFFHQFRTAGNAVFLQNGIVFFIACLHPDREHSCQCPHGTHAFHISSRCRAPLIVLRKLLHGVFCLAQFLLRLVLCQVINIRPSAGHQRNRPVAVNDNAFNIYAPSGPYNGIPVIADFRYGTGQTDRIKTVFRSFGFGLILL